MFKKSAEAAGIDLEILLTPVMDEELTVEIKQFKNIVRVSMIYHCVKQVTFAG